MTLINVDDGTDYTEDAVAIDNFSIEPQFFAAGSISPNLNNAHYRLQRVGSPSRPARCWPTTACTSRTWGPGATTPFAPTQQVDAVSAVLMHDQVLNEFVLDAATHSGTDWVMTFPTKRFYLNALPPNGNTGPAVYLFQRNFNGNAGSCDDVSSTCSTGKSSRRKARSRRRRPAQSNSLCWEANVISSTTARCSARRTS